jgi:hypothetical protein
MISRFRTYRQKRFDEKVEAFELDNPLNNDREIGGRRFRVGFDDAGIPSRYRKRLRNRRIAVFAGGAVVFGFTGYGVATFAQSGSAPAASVCNAASTHDIPVRGAQAAGHDPVNFNLNVFNSTNRDSLAAVTAAELRQRGFTVDLVSNDPLRSNLTAPAEVRGSKAEISELREVAAEVPGARIQTDSRWDPSVDLVLGDSFSGLIDLKQANCTQ